MTDLPVDDDVALPRRRGRPSDEEAHRFPIDKLRRMGIGQSIFVPGIMAAFSMRAKVSELVRMHRNAQYASRIFESDPKYKQPGLRVWRVR
jgi:hypothetical protein